MRFAAVQIDLPHHRPTPSISADAVIAEPDSEAARKVEEFGENSEKKLLKIWAYEKIWRTLLDSWFFLLASTLWSAGLRALWGNTIMWTVGRGGGGDSLLTTLCDVAVGFVH